MLSLVLINRLPPRDLLPRTSAPNLAPQSRERVCSLLIKLDYMPVILALGKLSKENREFKISHGYIVRPCLKKMKEGKQLWNCGP